MSLRDHSQRPHMRPQVGAFRRMAMKTGPKPKPARLRAIEGNPSKRPIREGVRVAPQCPDRPAWGRLLPGQSAEAKSVRRDAQRMWDTTVIELDKIGLLGLIDGTVVIDFCVCVARLLACERALSRDGLWVKGERGIQKHPALTAAGQYRTQLRHYVGELGLSPSSRTRLDLPGDGSGDDPTEQEVFGA